MATGPAVTLGEGNGGREKLSAEDEHIMQQTYAEALSFMGYRPDLIVYAVKMLHNQQKVVEAGRLLLEVEKLSSLEKSGEILPPLEWSKAQAHQRSDNDRDYESDNSEYADARSEITDDLQTDGEQPAMKHRVKRDAVPGDQVRKGKGQGAGDPASLQRKLRALRHENQLLKARQQCRSCHQRPVSITFLPCGHYSYCYDCGQKFGTCPICRKTILADVKTFLA